MKCNKQLKYSNYVALSHFHRVSVNNSGLELYIDNFDDYPKLKKVVLELEDFLAKDIRSQIPAWKEKNVDLEVVIGTGA